MEERILKNQRLLRLGITTGSCAAAAARAASQLLLTGILSNEVTLVTPSGKELSIPVNKISSSRDMSEFMVIKDSGDDPDVTDKAEIYVSVRRAENIDIDKNAFYFKGFSELFLDGGEGIGRVCSEGLEQKIGQSAINKVPRAMIFGAVDDVCRLAGYRGRLLITVSVPNGRELSEHTFNPRLGIEGGISILGTSGILEPMSERALIDTIELRIKQLAAMGAENLVFTPGNYGQSYAHKYLGIDETVKCSNFIGEALDMALVYNIKSLLLIGNAGKLVKLSAGIMNTHSLYADGRREIMTAHSVLCGADKKTAERLMSCLTVDEMLEILDKEGIMHEVMQSVCTAIHEHIKRRTKERIDFGVMLFSEKYGFLCQTEGTDNVIEKIKGEI